MVSGGRKVEGLVGLGDLGWDEGVVEGQGMGVGGWGIWE